MRRAHSGLPNFTLLQFAVAQHRINARGALLQSHPHRHSEGNGKTLAKRARARLDPRQIADVGMALERAVQLAQCKDFPRFAKPMISADSVKCGCRVALRQYKAVAVRIIEL